PPSFALQTPFRSLGAAHRAKTLVGIIKTIAVKAPRERSIGLLGFNILPLMNKINPFTIIKLQMSDNSTLAGDLLVAKKVVH
ncbi:MAG TPA: hypothetical protein V6C46_00405, partial [Coleofasciculaceae cyanobacterium]